MTAWLRRWYRRHVHLPALDRGIYAMLDALTNALARVMRFSFPRNYIRRWKLDMLCRSYERHTVALFKRIVKPGMTVIDIGAHIGYFTRLFSEHVKTNGRVYAFEADDENFILLEQNTRMLKNVTREKLALTDTVGRTDFYHYDDKSGAHSTLPNVPLPFLKKKVTVNASTLDSWVARNGIRRVDIIKMDIEGGESAALRGMRETLARTNIFVTEFAPAWIEAAGHTPREFLRSIEDAGFSISAITDAGPVDIHSMSKQEWDRIFPARTDGSHSEFVNLYCMRR